MLVLLVDVERHDAKIVRGGDLDDVREAHLGVVLAHERAERVAQLLEQLGVALVQRLTEDNIVVAQQ